MRRFIAQRKVKMALEAQTEAKIAAAEATSHRHKKWEALDRENQICDICSDETSITSRLGGTGNGYCDGCKAEHERWLELSVGFWR
jgi:hypothetical protein